MAQGKPKNGKQISMTIDSDILENLDSYCELERRSRTSAIELAIVYYLEHVGFTKKEGQ